ncbi:hypothetical protein FRC20_006187, partial [Serendipita sp. 405]
MEGIILRGITIELSVQGDHFLKDVFHLILDLKANDRSVDKANLLASESSPGVWDANEPLILPEIVAHYTLSVFAELGGEERQLLASQKLYGPDLCDRLEGPAAIPLDGHENHPSMILKAELATVADLSRQPLGAERPNNQTEESHHQNLAPNLGDQIRKSECRRDLENLLQLLSRTASNNYGISSSYGFDDFENLEDINKRIEREQEPVGSMPDGHPDMPSRLNNFGNSLLSQFEQLGNLDEIDNAIARHQVAVNLTPDGHPDKPTWLSNLGSSLLTRFERLGNLDDIDNAIARHQAAVNLTPDGHPHKP